VAVNQEIDEAVAQAMSRIFLEVIIAPAYSEPALAILKEKKNLRLLLLPEAALPLSAEDPALKAVSGGLLVQDQDLDIWSDGEFHKVTEAAIQSDRMSDLEFAMKVVKHVKSNAIVLVRDGQTVGIGPGQPNRITSAEIAIKNAGEKSRGAVMGSDAFFPFPDCVEAAAAAGVAAIVQPGGSIRDKESIDACNAHGLPMYFTGMRHFRH